MAIANAWAVNPQVDITQYAHTAWRMEEGFFAGPPQKIVQTSDGYLWIGTVNGLYRFDGVRFVSWVELTNQKAFTSARVSALLGTRDGSLWIGAGYRLYQWKNQKLIEYSTRDEFINTILEDRDGTIWVARQPERSSDKDGALCRVKGGGLRCYGPDDGVAIRFAGPLVQGLSGKLWVGGFEEVVGWNPASPAKSDSTFLSFPRSLGSVEALAMDQEDTLWVGMGSSKTQLVLGQIKNGKWAQYHDRDFPSGVVSITRLLIDRDDAVWIGTEDRGVYRITKRRIDHFNSGDGLSGDNVTDLFQDREGSMWVTTTKGIDSFHDLPILAISEREGLHLDSARSILAATDGMVWIGTDGALQTWRNGSMTSILPKDGLPGRGITSLYEDATKRLWVGIGSALYRYSHGRFRRVMDAGLGGMVFAMANAAHGDVWIVTSGLIESSLLRIRNDQVIERYTYPGEEVVTSIATDRNGGLWIAGDRLRYLLNSRESVIPQFDSRYGYIRNIAVDEDESVWFAATKGLLRFKDGHMQAMTAANGLPCDHINTLIMDRKRAVWIYAQCGLIKIERSELERWWAHPERQIKLSTFDATDGFQGGAADFRPAAVRDATGRLWFVNGTVVQAIDVDHIPRNTVTPPVHIEDLVADTRSFAISGPLKLPKQTRNLEIRYTGLSFVVPQRVRFRYKLEGFDSKWQEAGVRRAAFYTNLRPGKYRFFVTASNNDGVWNTTPATITFQVLPAFYQTAWFTLLLCGCLVFGLLAVDSLRVRNATARVRERLEERLQERSRIARELHDTLIQSVDGLMIYLQAAIDEADSRRSKAMLEKALDRADEVLSKGREQVYALRTEALHVDDLAKAIMAYASDRAQEREIEFVFTEQGTRRLVNPLVRDETFCIAREALANAFQHSGGTRVEVVLDYSLIALILTIRDNGIGIPEDFLINGRPGHWGLAGMRERAGKVRGELKIASGATEGTEVILRLRASKAYPRRFTLSLSSIFKAKSEDHCA
jgi:signal transduction histidine kinase/ligand-binding sensor domain-containing protein